VNGSDLASAAAAGIIAIVAVACAITAAVVVGAIYGLPWLWSLLKPWLHAISG
jgi:hypothetical protein